MALSNDPTAPLDDVETAAWRAFVVLWRIGLPQLDRTFKRQGLNHLEYGILAVLADRPEGRLPAGELADLAGITSSRLSHRLKVMEDRGDVERCAADHDARGVDVVVTAQGRARVEAATGPHRADIRRLLFDHLEPAQVEALADALVSAARALTDLSFLADYDRLGDG